MLIPPIQPTHRRLPSTNIYLASSLLLNQIAVGTDYFSLFIQQVSFPNPKVSEFVRTE